MRQSIGLPSRQAEHRGQRGSQHPHVAARPSSPAGRRRPARPSPAHRTPAPPPPRCTRRGPPPRQRGPRSARRGRRAGSARAPWSGSGPGTPSGCQGRHGHLEEGEQPMGRLEQDERRRSAGSPARTPCAARRPWREAVEAERYRGRPARKRGGDGDAPGRLVTVIPSASAAVTRRYPGSLTSGVPASLTTATSAPSRSLASSSGTRLASLCSCREIVLARIAWARASVAKCRVSSTATTSAARSVSSARSVMSAGLPIGTATRCRVPLIGRAYIGDGEFRSSEGCRGPCVARATGESAGAAVRFARAEPDRVRAQLLRGTTAGGPRGDRPRHRPDRRRDPARPLPRRDRITAAW